MLNIMTKQEFAPKDAETLKAEITADLGIEYEGNEGLVDKLVERGKRDEDFKASLHADKTKHLSDKESYKQILAKAGFNPETGEKLGTTDSPKNEGLSIKDAKAIQDIPEEDIEEVVDFAKYKGISIAEAKNNPVMKTLLKTKAEERATAEATQTNTQRRVSKSNAPDVLISKVHNQEDMSDDEMKLAAQAVVAGMKKNR